MSIITRLIDDFNDEELRNYWENNYQYLLKVPIKRTVAVSDNLFNPVSNIVIHPSDYPRMSMVDCVKEEHLVHTRNVMQMSNQQIYDLINLKMANYLSEIMSSSMRIEENAAFLFQKLQLFSERDYSFIRKEYDEGLLNFKNFYNLKYPSKDLLFLSMLSSYFGYKMNNKELLEYTNDQVNEFQKESKNFFRINLP